MPGVTECAADCLSGGQGLVAASTSVLSLSGLRVCPTPLPPPLISWVPLKGLPSVFTTCMKSGQTSSSPSTGKTVSFQRVCVRRPGAAGHPAPSLGNGGTVPWQEQRGPGTTQDSEPHGTGPRGPSSRPLGQALHARSEWEPSRHPCPRPAGSFVGVRGEYSWTLVPTQHSPPGHGRLRWLAWASTHARSRVGLRGPGGPALCLWAARDLSFPDAPS